MSQMNHEENSLRWFTKNTVSIFSDLRKKKKMESICVEDSVKIQHRMEELHHVTHALKNSILLMAFKQQYLTVHFLQFFSRCLVEFYT